MPCIVCDHTLQKVNDGKPAVFWCPRCGTLKMEGEVPEFEEPRLVKYTKQMHELARKGEYPSDSLIFTISECIGE